MIHLQRLIIIDWSVIVHRSIFALKFNPKIPPTYTAQSMILGTLSRIGLDPDDVVMFVCDGRHSWRQEFEPEYKGNRKQHRDQSGIDFDYWFKQFNILRQRLDEQTNWIFIGPLDHIEADDIAAVACRHFTQTNEIVLVTIDSDWEQLWVTHPNVKIFSLMTKKWKIKPENYNVYAELAKKVHKEVSDNLVSSVTTSDEYDKRLMLVDLTRLPEWVEKKIKHEFLKEEIYFKDVDYETMPSKSLQRRLNNLYNDKSKVVDYNKQILKAKRKADRIKAKKSKIKK